MKREFSASQLKNVEVQEHCALITKRCDEMLNAGTQVSLWAVGCGKLHIIIRLSLHPSSFLNMSVHQYQSVHALSLNPSPSNLILNFPVTVMAQASALTAAEEHAKEQSATRLKLQQMVIEAETRARETQLKLVEHEKAAAAKLVSH
jgi:hypothetical protein